MLRKIDVQNFTRATRSTSREINRQILLNLIREHQPISRAELARRLGVGRSMVTSLVNELLEEGSILEGDTADSARGRKPTMLYLRTRDRMVVAIDVRFSRTYVMLSDFEGTELAIETFETVFSPEALVEELAVRVRRMVETYGATGRVEGIGLVVPGMVDHETGRVLNSPQLGWRGVEVRDALAAAAGLPVYIENAPIACALAQMWLGQRGGGANDFVYVTVSDGVGAGVVVNGQVVRGSGHTAGEFGHTLLSLEGPQCLCGARGCLEAYTSNLATVARFLGREPSPATARRLLQQREVTVAELITRARTGSEEARAALEETGRYLGLGLSMIVNTLNPSQIFVGGEITAAWDLIEQQVRAPIAERALTELAAATPVIPEQTSAYPRLRGAIVLVAARMFAAPSLV